MLKIYQKLGQGKQRHFRILLFITMTIGVAGLVVSLLYIRSMRMMEVKEHLLGTGNYDFVYYNMSDRMEKAVKADKRVGKMGALYQYKNARSGESGQEVTIGALMDQNVQDMSYIPTVAGRFPDKENEICIDRMTLKQLGLADKLGEKIELSVYDETKKTYCMKKYTLCGIIELLCAESDGTIRCLRQALVTHPDQVEEKYEKYPMAYVSAKEAKKSMHLEQKNYFVDLKKLTDKSFEDFGHDYNFNEKWYQDFCGNISLYRYRTENKHYIIHDITWGEATETEDELKNIQKSGQTIDDFYTSYMVPTILFVIGLIAAIGIYDVVRISIEQRKKQYGTILCLGMTVQRLVGEICAEFAILMFGALGIGYLLGGVFYETSLCILEKYKEIQIPSSLFVDDVFSYYLQCIKEVTHSPWILPGVVLIISGIVALLLGIRGLVKLNPIAVEDSRIHKVKRNPEKTFGLYRMLNRYLGRGPFLNQCVPWISVILLVSVGVFGFIFFRCKAAYDYRDLQDHIEEAGMGNFDYYMDRTDETMGHNVETQYLEGRHDTGVSKKDYDKLASVQGIKEIHGIIVNRSSALVYDTTDVKSGYLRGQLAFDREAVDIASDDIEKVEAKKEVAFYESMGIKKNENVYHVPTIGVEKNDISTIEEMVKDEDIDVKMQGKIHPDKLADGSEVVVLVKKASQKNAFEVGESLPLRDFMLPSDMDSDQSVVSSNLPERYKTEYKKQTVKAGEYEQVFWNYYNMVSMTPKVGAIIYLEEYQDNFYFEDEDNEDVTVNILTLTDAFKVWGLPDKNYTRIGVVKDYDNTQTGKSEKKNFDKLDKTWYQTVSRVQFVSTFSIDELEYTVQRGQKNVMAIFYVLMFLIFITGFISIANNITLRVEQMQRQNEVLGLIGFERSSLTKLYLLRFEKMAVVGAVVSIIPVEIFSSFCTWCSQKRNALMENGSPELWQREHGWLYKIPNFKFRDQPLGLTVFVCFIIVAVFIFFVVLWKCRNIKMDIDSSEEE